VASLVASRSTCPRKHVGAVLVRDKRIVASGFNGSLPGQPHCDDVGCLIINGGCTRTLHAEANVIMQAARFGIPTEGATLYVNISPCVACAKLIVGAHIARVIYRDLYRDLSSFSFAHECGLVVQSLETADGTVCEVTDADVTEA
jgi:dCMP deaminase